MTKTEARRLARKARAGGYYDPPGADYYVFCPVCRQRVDCPHTYGATVNHDLDAGMLFHLETYCEGTTR